MASQNESGSKYWKYFTKLENGRARCELCQKNVTNKGGCTSAMKNHLKLHASVKLEDKKATLPFQQVQQRLPTTTQPSIASGFKQVLTKKLTPEQIDKLRRSLAWFCAVM